MGKYRSLGTLFNRVFRNDLNANFDAVDADISAQKTRVDNLITSVPQPSEVVDARGAFTVLGDRFIDYDTQIELVLGTGILGEKFPRLSGETDDSPRISRAISELNKSGKLVLTAVSYTLSQPILLPENVSLEGKGHGLSTTLIDYTGTGFAIRSTGQHSRNNISGIRIKLNGSNSGILIGDVYANLGGYVPGNALLKNITVEGVAPGQYGLMLNNVSHTSMEGVFVGFGNTTGGTGLKITSDTLNSGVISALNCVFGRQDKTDVGLVIDGTSALDSFEFVGCYFGGKTKTVELGLTATGVVRNANFRGCHYEASSGGAIELYNVVASSFQGASIQGYGTVSYAFVIKGLIKKVNFFNIESNKVTTSIFRNEYGTSPEECVFQAAVKTGGLSPAIFDGTFSNSIRFDEGRFRMPNIVPEEIWLGGRKHTYGTAAPTTGTNAQGDTVYNTQPTELGTAGSKYVIEGWKCVGSGTPGTWVQMRTLTGN